MKKTLIAIIILVILAAGSFAAFFIAKNKKDKQEQAAMELAADYALFSFDSNSAFKIEINCPDGQYTAEYIDEKWKLTNSDDFKLSNSYAQGVASYMSTLTALKDYGEATDENKKSFGLDNPTIINLYENNNVHTIYVGNMDPTGTYYYVMVEGKSKIYAVDSSTGGMFKATRILMKDPYIVYYEDSEITNIELVKNGNVVYELSYNPEEDTWNLPSEYSHLKIDKTTVTRMLAVMTRVTAQEFLDENLEDYSKYGFDNPAAELTVTGKDGSTVQLLFSYYGNDTLTYTHVLNVDTGQVATALTGDVDFIEDTPADFMVAEVCPVSIHDLSAMNFSYNGSNDVFDIDMDANEVTMNGTSISALGNDAYEAFNNFYYSITYMTLESVDISVNPDYTDPILSVEFVFEDESSTLFELCQADEDSCYVFFDGKYNGVIVNMSDVSGKNSTEDFYEKLLDIVNP